MKWHLSYLLQYRKKEFDVATKEFKAKTFDLLVKLEVKDNLESVWSSTCPCVVCQRQKLC